MLGIDFSHVINEHDHKLCEDANMLPYTEWAAINPEDAITEEGKQVLENMQRNKRFQEEYESYLF